MTAKVAKSPQHQAITQGEAPLAERLEQRLAAAPTLTVAATTDPQTVKEAARQRAEIPDELADDIPF
jgi:hypothetical protein